MLKIESGNWLIPSDEQHNYLAAAALLRQQMGLQLDVTQPMPTEHAAYLKWSLVVSSLQVQLPAS